MGGQAAGWQEREGTQQAAHHLQGRPWRARDGTYLSHTQIQKPLHWRTGRPARQAKQKEYSRRTCSRVAPTPPSGMYSTTFTKASSTIDSSTVNDPSCERRAGRVATGAS